MALLLQLLTSVAAQASGGRSAPISPACQLVLDLYCNAGNDCVPIIQRDGFELPLVARADLMQKGEWRCYSPSALDKTKSRYVGGKAYCSQPAQLSAVLAVCNGTHPGPYPLPPAPPSPSGPGDYGCVSPFISDGVNSTLVPLDNSRDTTEYRIPVVVAIPGSRVVLVLAENRLAAHGDSGRHALALSRSVDDGASFGPAKNILRDPNGTVDGLNLGAAIWDGKQKRLSVLFNECFHLNAVGKGCGASGQLLQIDSDTEGMTWSAVTNHTESFLAQGYKQLNPGPGTGVQLQFQTDKSKNGRLLMPAWGSKIADPKGTQTRAFVLISEPDMHTTAADTTWRAVVVPPDPPVHVPNELQCAELPDGKVVLNVRSGNSNFRLISVSEDGGDTWSPLTLAPSTGEQAICQGSMIAVGSVLFYSHPFHATARSDGWIKFSLDQGSTWFPWAQVDPNSFGYSGLTMVSSNTTHVTLGVVWEGGNGTRSAKLFLLWGSVDHARLHSNRAPIDACSFVLKMRGPLCACRHRV